MKPKSKGKPPQPDLPPKPVTHCYLADLHFDRRNPRFGPWADNFKDEAEILHHIAETFGVEDVLSSLAVNGYFESEPLVGIKEAGKDGISILEGNRRLAACLILDRDPRAKHQKKRQEHYGIIHAKHDYRRINPVPVIVFEGPTAAKELLPYLGVRHIVGSTDWDSFSKAAWVASVVKSRELNLDDVMQMIGDDMRQSERMLAAYYLVDQLIRTGRFDPADSIKKGRGSNAEFPFSLVYNALDNTSIWEWVGFTSPKSALKENPLPKNKLADAELLLLLLCGSRSKGFQPAIKESREIRDLAKAISDPAQRLELKRGKSVAEAVVEALPTKERLVEGLGNVRAELQTLVGVLARARLSAADATELLPLSRDVREVAKKLNEEVLEAANQDDARKGS
jgi:hypothetical protein